MKRGRVSARGPTRCGQLRYIDDLLMSDVDHCGFRSEQLLDLSEGFRGTLQQFVGIEEALFLIVIGVSALPLVCRSPKLGILKLEPVHTERLEQEQF